MIYGHGKTHTNTKKEDTNMERNYNVSGADRKALVKVIGEALGVKP